MSVMTAFQNLFNSGASAPATPAPAAQPTPGNLPAQPLDQGTPANNNAPAAGANPEPKQDGFDQFADLWKPNESSGKPENNGMFNVDPAKLMEAAGRMDFSKAVAPEQLQAIAAGGEGAVAAFAAAMNKVAQTVYAQNAMATTKIVEQAVARTKDGFINDLPRHIKNQQVSDTLRTENPAFSHPAAAPILGALQQQLSVKFPQATSAELAGMAKSYLENFANLANSGKTESSNTNQTKPGEMDWSTFL